MARMNDKQNDYRINLNSVGAPVSVEVTCCGRHIGEMRLKEGEERKCSQCQAVHTVSMGHNHFHIRRR